jgi:hypothetical protein
LLEVQPQAWVQNGLGHGNAGYQWPPEHICCEQPLGLQS